jgi:hypothetical protein
MNGPGAGYDGRCVPEFGKRNVGDVIAMSEITLVVGDVLEMWIDVWYGLQFM